MMNGTKKNIFDRIYDNLIWYVIGFPVSLAVSVGTIMTVTGLTTVYVMSVVMGIKSYCLILTCSIIVSLAVCFRTIPYLFVFLLVSEWPTWDNDKNKKK